MAIVRIAGITLNSKKHARFALTPIKGVGKSNVKDILKALDIPFDAMLGDLEEKKIVEIRNYIEKNYLVEADLRRQKQADIKRLVELNTWRGKRHELHLPVRGQRTRNNSRTVRGKKKGDSPAAKANKK
jgi:small subunit ribosomal protein S13